MALIGDRERERAAALLRRDYVRGRLTLEELTERLEVALTARRESEARLALVNLPSGWSTEGAFTALSSAVRRTMFVVAVWALWWAASLVLLIGFVAMVVVQGMSISTAVVFPTLWFVCTFGAVRITRRGRHGRARPRAVR